LALDSDLAHDDDAPLTDKEAASNKKAEDR
jgi:hypothetical protein